ncbi:hypothetical protein Q8V56_001656 [Vibrio cholerae]|nr:hypothetical protein [Vibrio cholerae]
MSPTVNRRSAEHLELIFEIYSLIPTTRKITAREIQQALSDKGVNRTKRTVQRYLDSLLNYFDIEQDTRSQPYGYRRKITTKLTFSPRDHMMFNWAEASLKALLPKNYHEAVEHAFTPLRAPGQKRVPIDIRGAKHPVDRPYNKEVFDTLCLAVFHHREVRITLNKQALSLYINPLGFISKNHRLYLAYQHQDEFLLVDLVDVLSVYLTTFGYQYPESFELKELGFRQTQ